MSCVVGPGERIARMELAILLGTAVHQFKLQSSDETEELRPAAKLLLSPDERIKATITFIPR